MASFQNQIMSELQGFKIAFVDALVETMRKNAPVKSGNLQRNIQRQGEGITAPSYLKELEEGISDDVAMNAIYEQTYTRFTAAGKQVTVTRQYKGMKPKKIFKKSAGGGNPWRVVPMYGRPPLGLIQGALSETTPRIPEIIKSYIPEQLQITSFK